MADLMTLPPTITVPEAAELLGVGVRSAYRAVQKGQIPSLRVGRRLLVPTAGLLRLVGLSSVTDRSTKNNTQELEE